MDKEDKGIIILLITIFSIFGYVIHYSEMRSNTFYDYPIYKATLPFGVIQTEGRFVIGTGSIGSEEYYYIKYFRGNELISVILQAKYYPLIIDGKFYISVNELGTRYYIHIPRLPELNQTWTMEWIK